MKKTISVLLCLAMMLSMVTGFSTISFAMGGTTYYVDSVNGNDSNSGTSESSAWANLSTHSDYDFQSGDTILLKAGGVYTGLFMPKSSGSEESPITISAYGNTAADGLPVLMSLDNGPTIFLLNVSHWNINNLEFTASKNGAGIYIYSLNYEEIPEFDFSMDDEDDEEDDSSAYDVLSYEGLKAALHSVSTSFDEVYQTIREKAEWLLGIEEEEDYSEYWAKLPDSNVISGFEITDCVFHDIANYRDEDLDGDWCPINIDADGKGAKVNDVHISDLEIYDCGYGIRVDGLSQEFEPELFISAEESYNSNYLIENVNIHDCAYGAFLLGAIYNGTVRNCSAIHDCFYDDWFTAPLWTHYCDNVTIENCEVADTENWKDGMTVDFDGWTTNTTYQYIYSHDNICFMKSNNFDDTTKNRNNTVRYCLSVNDNKLINIAAISNISERYSFADRAVAMDNFRFYNNTIINCAPTLWGILQNSTIENNIFVGSQDGLSSISLTLGTKNRIKNNCFWGMSPMAGATKSLLCNPGFIGEDLTDKNSFMLSKDSSLIGTGLQVEDDMGDCDFYGNALTSTHNIGCYDGSGESASSSAFSRAFTAFGRLILWLKQLFAKLFS